MNSEANLLGPKKSSERIYLNNEKIIKENTTNKLPKFKSENNINPIKKTETNVTKLNYF